MKLSVIIPVYNEEKTIAKIIRQVKLLKGLNKEIIVINDASSDKTSGIIKNIKGIIVVEHKINQGKGTAIKTGVGKATGDYVLIQDADLEYDPQDVIRMWEPIQKGKAGVVYGSRFTGQRRNMFFWHWIGNQLLTLVTDILYNTTLSDMETGYKLIPLPLLKSLNIQAKKFEFEPEVTAKILKRGIRIWEVPISYAGREYNEGKKITWKDFFPALFTLIKYRFIN